MRFHYLPLEYWHPRILFEIAGSIGTPILIDENTTNHSFGHYARVPVDINLAGILPDSLWVEREEFILRIIVKKILPIELLVKRLLLRMIMQKKIIQYLVNKKHVDEVQGCNKVVTNEDPIVFYILRSKEKADGVTVGDAINLEEELFTSISAEAFSMQSVQVEIIDPALQNEDQT